MHNVLRLSAILLALGISATTVGAKNTNINTLYSFCSQKACKDGRMPMGLPAHDAQGNYYVVTTTIDGNGSAGTIDQLIPGDKHYKGKVLYTFTDSGAVTSGVITDVNGNLYGVTADGIYELSPGGHKKWKYKVIYTFCPDGNCTFDQPTGELSYAGAASGLPYDGVSPLYGTARSGGANLQGAVYQLVPNGDHWDASPVYSFCPQAQCADGSNPYGGVYVAGDGSIYGVTNRGGNDVDVCTLGCGVLFHLSSKTSRMQQSGEWKDETVYAFCSLSNCTDGKEPIWKPTMDAQGNLIGAESNVVFKLSKSGKQWTFSALHTIPTALSSVTIDATGAMYGESASSGQGQVYRLSGSDLTVLHSFCLKETCKDGAQPAWGLLLDASGNLFGITQSGANLGGSGTLFEITP